METCDLFSEYVPSYIYCFSGRTKR